MLLGGGLPWGTLLAPANLRFGTAVPWAIGPMAAYLWAYWKFIRGDWGPSETAASRRLNLRATALSGEAWGTSLLAGMLGFAALFAFLAVMARLVPLPASAAITTPEGMPRTTAFLLLIMSSIVAGVTEESAFRGYMQGPIERRHGPVVAILLNGALFGAVHVTHHPASVVTMLPYYLAVVSVYGRLAYATNSILPGIVLHAGGDVFSLTRFWATGQPEWQLSAEPPALIWESGADAAFWGYIGAFVLLGAGAVWAYSALAGAARAEANHAHES